MWMVQTDHHSKFGLTRIFNYTHEKFSHEVFGSNIIKEKFNWNLEISISKILLSPRFLMIKSALFLIGD